MSVNNINCIECNKYICECLEIEYIKLTKNLYLDNINNTNNTNIIDISKNIIMNIRNHITNMICELDIIMNKIDKDEQELKDFEKIKIYINNINNLINDNNIDKENFKIIKIFEEINNKQIKNEELIKIALCIYKKNFLGIFKNNNFRINIVNKNFYEFILNEIKKEQLTERYKNKLIKTFLDEI